MPSLGDATGGRILFGGDYNPEQWPREVWDEDVRLMREAGVNLATVGVFSWALLEPRPGGTRLRLAHRGAGSVARQRHRRGAGHPDRVDAAVDGPPLARDAAAQPGRDDPDLRFAQRLLSVLSGVPGLRRRDQRRPGDPSTRITRRCGCGTSATSSGPSAIATGAPCASAAGSRPDTGTSTGSNEAWGTAFWSQRYGDWDEVIPPRQVQYVINPTQDLDYQRFASDLLLEGFTTERDIVRGANPAIPITTNSMTFFKATDLWRWGAEEDFTALDSYPDPNSPQAARDGAMAQDLIRSVGGGKPWLMMEQTPGRAGFRHVATPKRPGLNRLWSLQAVARGADGILHFQWRASKQGAERTHGAMLPHAGPDSRIFREVCDLGKELGDLTDVLGAEVAAEVAILLDWDSWRAVELDHQPHSGFRYVDRIREYYTPLWKTNVTVDFVHPEADLSRYKLVVAPNLYQVSDAAADNVIGYVERGGNLVVGPFSGVADPDERIRLGGYPAPFRDLLGLRIEEYWPLPDDEPLTLRSELFGDFSARSWAEWLAAGAGTALAEIAAGPLTGIPAIVRNAYGAGTAWYVATLPEERVMARLLALACEQAGVESVLPGLPDGVEAVRRGEYVFVLDHGRGTVEIRSAVAATL